MALNAKLAIAAVPGAQSKLREPVTTKRSGGNAQLMWGPKYSRITGADSTLQNNLAFVSGS